MEQTTIEKTIWVRYRAVCTCSVSNGAPVLIWTKGKTSAVVEYVHHGTNDAIKPADKLFENYGLNAFEGYPVDERREHLKSICVIFLVFIFSGVSGSHL